ncbi:hypothetical protein FJZ40_03295 [Candidatus Shapirobacteria bacterium]|nr:hypothetical protein [Candidatus Shapirobacteria bacterium]
MKEVFEDNASRVAVILSAITSLLAIGYLLLTVSHLPSEVPLFYSRYWGEEQLAQKGFLALLPGLSFLALALNFLLASRLFAREKLLAQIILWSAAVFSLLATVTLVKIVLLVG